MVGILDMKIIVVLAGHTYSKLQRLMSLYQANMPSEDHQVIIVYNGKGDYLDADITCINDKNGKDVYMYHKAVEYLEADYYFFMNDDVCYIKDNKWLAKAIKANTEVVGVQANLASLFPIEVLVKENKNIPARWRDWKGKPQFIRTSAFGCTQDYFLRVWNASNGDAQKFEKQTITLAKSWKIFDNAFYIFDENLQPYFKYYKK
jgi:hypothetical protein